MIDGVLVVDKPRGPTSQQVVAKARRRFNTRRAGHAGTLDPMATGVLLVLLGEATKLSGHLTLDDKRYRATVALGRSTDTLDAEGRTTHEWEPGSRAPDRDAVLAAVAAERERREQVPPAFSAIKVAGQPAHKRSRRGEQLELEPRRVSVEELELVELEGANLVLEMNVSKGYYVRALARDLGARLGVPAHLAALRRLASGPFRIEEAVPWPPEDEVTLISVADAACRALPSVRLLERGERRARLGQKLEADDFVGDAETIHGAPGSRAVAWLGSSGELLALGERRDETRYAVLRGFNAR